MSSEVIASSPATELPQYGAPLALAGRILLSAIFLVSAVGKLAAPGGTIGYIAAAGLPLPTDAYAIAVLVELFGGRAVLAGYQTRISAAALTLFCIPWAFRFHARFWYQTPVAHFLHDTVLACGL